MTWLIALQGDAADVEEFPQRFPSGAVHAIVEGNSTYLTGPSFDQCSDASEVLVRAKRILEEMSGVISLGWPAFKKPKLGAVLQRDSLGRENTRTVFLEGVEARTKVGTPTIGHACASVQPGPTDAQRLLAKSRSSPHLTAATSLWAATGRGWSQLYRIVEEITKHLKGSPDALGHCNRTDLKRFGQSAQSHDTAGLGARHAIGYAPAPKHPMDFEEATRFVEKLLQSVLRES